MRKIIGYTLIGLVGLLILCGVIGYIIEHGWLCFIISVVAYACLLFMLALGIWLIHDKD